MRTCTQPGYLSAHRSPAGILAVVALAVLASACGSAYEPTKDEVECALPDGSRFILRSTYLGLKPIHKHPTNVWNPGSRGLNRSGFATYYRPANDGQELLAAGGQSWGLFIRERNNLDFMAHQCASTGLINGVPFSLATHYMAPGSVEFETINWQNDLFRAVIIDSRKGEAQFADVEARGWRFDRYAIIWRPDLLVMESALVAKDAPDPAPVLGAYRIESRDGGQTWANPHLTLEPEVFELGKPGLEQCFMARLVRIDIEGEVRHFEPNLQDCPVMHALPARQGS